jgi:penicillin V acylase-like amidase (Ntn superfamily)
MTNEPDYHQRLATNEYWAPIRNSSLPGTDRPVGRLACFSCYMSDAPVAETSITSLATAAGMIRAVSVPNEPNIVNTPDIT